MTKAQIRKLEREARRLRLLSCDEIAKAIWSAADGDDAGFNRAISEAAILARRSAEFVKQARAASDLNGDA